LLKVSHNFRTLHETVGVVTLQLPLYRLRVTSVMLSIEVVRVKDQVGL
jgi:hypothetical protein